MTITDERWFLEQLGERTDVNVDCESLGRALFMTWEQVRTLADSNTGLTVGSHSHGHHDLARLDDDSQRNELAGSKQILEAHLGREVRALAYPYGWPGTYTTLTKRLAKQTGYHLAFASREGVNRLGTLDPLEAKRLGVGSGDSPALLRDPHSTLRCIWGIIPLDLSSSAMPLSCFVERSCSYDRQPILTLAVD